jgi:CoA:oxalate CoA-transferase
MSSGPFSGVLVLDLTRVLAGPYCTMMLAELGARVIKIENPAGGDDARGFEPFLAGQSAYFSSLNRGKESIALDLKAEPDRTLFLGMLARADVLVENYRPGTLDRLGLGYEQLQPRYPRLIYAAISGFGHTGPWCSRPAYDLIVQALSGMMSLTGQADGPPTKVGTSIGDITAGLFALAGIASALYHREQTGKGMKVDVSMYDGQLAILESAVVRYANTGQSPQRIGNRHPAIAPFEAYQAQDGLLVIACGNDALFARLCQSLGRSELARDPRFASNRDRVLNVEELKVALESVLATRAVAEWCQVLEQAGIPCSPVSSVAEAVDHAQTAARRMIVEAEGLRMAGNPVKLSAFADPATRPPAPGLDADGDKLRWEFGGGE